MQSMITAVSFTRSRVRSVAAQLLAALVAAAMLLSACSSNSSVTVADADQDDATTSTPEPAAEPAAPTATSVPAADEPEEDDGDGGAATDGSDDTPADDEPEDDDSAGDDPSGDDDGGDAFVGADSGDFCRIARELDENDPFDDPDLPIFSEEFFDTVLEFYSRVEAISPDEIRPDFATIRVGLEQFAAIAAEADYNVLDPRFAEATEAIEAAEFDAAGERIEAYLAEVCGIDIGGFDDMDDAAPGTGAPPGISEDLIEELEGMDLENMGPEDIAALSQLFFAQLDLDPELQACLLENADLLAAAGSDPDVLNQEICGTTLLNILSGLG